METKYSNKRLVKSSVVLFVLLILTLLSISPAFAEEAAAGGNIIHARPSVNGMLHVNGDHLEDKDGNRVVLRGVSTHGLTWYPDLVNEDLFQTVSKDWDCNLVRLAAYSDIYANGDSEDTMELVRKGIEAAAAADMYVIVDWHILEEHDPRVNMQYAEDFFAAICSEYPNNPGIIFEICNEPNGDTTWSNVKEYSEYMIPLIRSYSPDNVILVGTPEYDRDLTVAGRSPLSFENIMYVLHFYTATHKDDLRMELQAALNAGLPVFISECGVSEASGDGKLDFASASEWFTILREHGTSFAVWSLSNKNESSALIKYSYNPKKSLTDADISTAGLWVRSLIRGEDPLTINVPEETHQKENFFLSIVGSLSPDEMRPVIDWPQIALYTFIFLIIIQFINYIFDHFISRSKTYDDVKEAPSLGFLMLLRRFALLVSMFFTIVYLTWRTLFTVPVEFGAVAVAGNVILLVVEIMGFLESLVLYANLMHMKDHPLPKIEEDEYPDVDIFIATYNEPAELLRKTINGCNHLNYPDRSKVHVWLCDDNRRAEIRRLAEDMHIGYFDRPDNKGAKAGNLNNALSKTSAPYVVTLDADMIPMKDFLMKTIPYFVDAEKHAHENGNIKLGLLQTPQCFYQPDVFQYALYSEKSAPNEQDFFYRTIEVAKTSSNSVIYGGSNTVLSREALNKVGGFFTKSITEDFATGLLIESAGFVSLGLKEPLASGMAPSSYKEHIQQRQRWGRGVISTARQLKLMTRPGLSMRQRLSYLSSVVYWYSPIKTFIYLVSPLLFAIFSVPVFKCSWADLLLYWFPMFIMQDVCIRVFSGNALSLKWSGIYETSVMPYLIVPLIKEMFGMTASKFLVTDKSGKGGKKKTDYRLLAPFLVFISLSVLGIIRSIYVLFMTKALGIFILLFWLTRNLYYLIMSVFLVDGRDMDSEDVKVVDAEMVTVKRINSENESPEFFGVTTFMTAHEMNIFLDDSPDIAIGDKVKIVVEKDTEKAELTGFITGEKIPRFGDSNIYSVQISDYGDSELEYLQVLYDRVPTLPQSLQKDLGVIRHLLVNIAHRILDVDRNGN